MSDYVNLYFVSGAETVKTNRIPSDAFLTDSDEKAVKIADISGKNAWEAEVHEENLEKNRLINGRDIPCHKVSLIKENEKERKVHEKVAYRFIKTAEPEYGSSPDQWHINKEVTPLEGSWGVNNNLPDGSQAHPLDKAKFHDRMQDKGQHAEDDILPSTKDTIEMILVRSDLSSDKVDIALSLLPATSDLFAYLKQEGLYDEPAIIKQVLNYY